MYIVTGGGGFIGSNIVKGLEDLGYFDTVICDSLGTDQKWRNIAKREFGSFIFPNELFQFLNENIKNVEGIIHMGALSSTTEIDADSIISNNFRLSQGLWSWCSLHKKRFIYASSAATYGMGKNGFIDHDTPDALKKLKPLNLYGWSKHAFDRWVSRLTKNKPVQHVGLKFFNVYGPNEYHKGNQQSVIIKAFETLQQGNPVKLFKSYSSKFKDGNQIRDFVYVKDCVDVVLWLIKHPEVNGLFNVGTGEGRTFNDLAEAVYTSMNKSAPVFQNNTKIMYVDMPENLHGSYQSYTVASMNKLIGEGYNKSFTTLEAGIQDYVQNYLNTDDKYL